MSEHEEMSKYLDSLSLQEIDAAVPDVTNALRVALGDLRKKDGRWTKEDKQASAAWETAISNNPKFTGIIEQLRSANIQGNELILHEREDNNRASMRRALSRTPFLSCIDRDAPDLLGNLLLVRVFNPNGSAEERRIGWRYRMDRGASEMMMELGHPRLYSWGSVGVEEIARGVLSGWLSLSSRLSQIDTIAEATSE